MDDIKSLVTRFYDTWNAHDRDGWLACCYEDINFTGPGALAFGCESVLARVPRGVLGSGDVAWLLLRCWAGFCGGRFVTFSEIGM